MHAALGPLEHVPHDLEPMPVLVGERQKYLKDMWFHSRVYLEQYIRIEIDQSSSEKA
jgi:hypothetical protein